MPAVAPLITGRIAEDATGAAYEYTPPTLTLLSGGQQSLTRIFGTFSQNGTITLPAGMAIFYACMLEVGGVISSAISFNVGSTPGGYDAFYTNMNKNQYYQMPANKAFYSTVNPTTLYVNTSSWSGMIVNLTLLLVQMV